MISDQVIEEVSHLRVYDEARCCVLLDAAVRCLNAKNAYEAISLTRRSNDSDGGEAKSTQEHVLCFDIPSPTP
jgi:hypothetical protein